MELIVKGVEEKKNKEIAQLRDEVEADIRSEWEVYASKMVGISRSAIQVINSPLFRSKKSMIWSRKSSYMKVPPK